MSKKRDYSYKKKNPQSVKGFLIMLFIGIVAFSIFSIKTKDPFTQSEHKQAKEQHILNKYKKSQESKDFR